MGGGLEIVEQPHALGWNGGGEPALVDDPGKVHGDDAAVHHRPRDAHAGRGDVGTRALAEKARDSGIDRQTPMGPRVNAPMVLIGAMKRNFDHIER